MGSVFLVLMLILLGSIFIGTPVAFGLGFSAVVLILVFLEPNQLMQIGSIAFSQSTNINQLVAPLFILMAETLSQGNIAGDIFFVLNKWLSRLRGGLALSTMAASTVFAALCGSSPATAAAIGPDFHKGDGKARVSPGFCRWCRRCRGHAGNYDSPQYQPRDFRRHH